MLVALTAAGFAGCTQESSPVRTQTAPIHNAAADSPPPMPGSDQDANGCKPSAGYSWCARTGRCERPWEVAKAQGFDNSWEAFRDWCRVGDGDGDVTNEAEKAR